MASAEETKAKEHESWSSMAPGWRKHDKRLTEPFGGVSLALLDKAGVKEGDAGLDVACGAGVTEQGSTIALLRRSPSGPAAVPPGRRPLRSPSGASGVSE